MKFKEYISSEFALKLVSAPLPDNTPMKTVFRTMSPSQEYYQKMNLLLYG